MDATAAFLLHAIVVGTGATLVLDLWTVVLRRVFGQRSLDWGLVGRWLGHMPHGRFTHDSIAAASAVRSERLIGWCFHYATGIAFAGLLLAVNGPDWARQPTLLPCVGIGLLTVVFPFFVMQPAMGIGVAASKAPKPGQARLRSIATHTVFGIGLYAAALLAAALAS